MKRSIGIILLVLSIVPVGIVAAQSTVIGHIADSDELLERRFTLDDIASGTTVTVEVVRRSGDLIPVVGLIPAAGGRPLASETDNASGVVKLEYRFEDSGDYDIVVTREGGQRGMTTGNFIIIIIIIDTDADTASTDDLPDLNGNRVILNFSGSVYGVMNSGQLADRYFMRLRQGATIQINIELISGDFTPRLLLLDAADERTIARASADTDVTTLRYEIEETGWYVITVTRTSRDESRSGEYYLSVERV